jgi:hypothetical protein
MELSSRVIRNFMGVIILCSVLLVIYNRLLVDKGSLAPHFAYVYVDDDGDIYNTATTLHIRGKNT